MKKYTWFISGLALAIIASTGVYLARHKPQVFGDPGVKVGPVRIFDDKGKVAAEQSVLLPETVLDATSKLGAISTSELTELPSDTTFGRRQYTFPDKSQVVISTVLMRTDRSSIHQPQDCLTGQGWSINKTEEVRLKIGGPAPYELPVLKLTTSIRKAYKGQAVTYSGLYVYWFVARDKTTLKPFERMWSTADSLLQKGVFERWAYISYFTTCAPGQEDATYKHLEKFITASVPEFQIFSGQPQAHK